MKTDRLAAPGAPNLADYYTVLSADGSTIAVAVPTFDPNNPGSVYVFRRDALGKIDAGNIARITSPTGSNYNVHFGKAMAMSADGNTIAVSRRGRIEPSGDPDHGGGVFIFVRSGDSWNHVKTLADQRPQIYADSLFGGERFEGSADGGLALSADGGVLVAGSGDLNICQDANFGQGSECDQFVLGGAFLYERPAEGWGGNPFPKVITWDNNNSGEVLTAEHVAISSAGDRVFIQGKKSPEKYAVYYARRPGGGWPQLTSFLHGDRTGRLGTDYNAGDSWSSFAINSSGTMLAVGLSSHNRALVWANIPDQSIGLDSGPSFAALSTTLNNSFGRSLAIKGDGSKIIVSGPFEYNTENATVISRFPGGWPTDGGEYPGVGMELFPVAAGRVAMSADGETLVAGADVLLPRLATPTFTPVKAVANGERFTLTISGSGFTNDTIVRWGDYILTQTRVTPTELDVTVPGDLVTSAGSASIFVQIPLPGGGLITLPYAIENPPPLLSELDPPSSVAGEPSLPLTVRGSHFLPSSVVRWDGAALATTYVNSATLRVELGAAQIASVGEASVTVSTPAPGGGTSASLSHSLVAAPAPQLAGVSPFSRAAGKPAFTLTAVGSDFMRRSQIVFAGQTLTTTYVNSGTLTAEVPAALVVDEGPLGVSITTTEPGGGESPAQTFTVTSAAPSLDDVFPFFGPPAGGTEVTLSGMNLESTSAVSFGGQPAMIVSAAETTLVVQAPAGAVGSADVTVTTRYGSATIRGGFVYATSEPAQPWRDFGELRLWADDFSTSEGLTVATGRISLGHAGRNARYFRVSDRVSWAISDTLTISGTLGFFGGQGLSSGRFSLDTASGAITAQPGALGLVSTLGSTAIAVNPTLTLNALEEQVPVTATLVVSLPENPAVGLTVQYHMRRDGTISGAGSSPLPLRLAGGNLSADVSVTNAGLAAPGARLSLPGLALISLPALTIDDSGLRFGGSTSFAMPDVDLGGGVLTLTGLQATLQSGAAGYELPLSGSLALANLPEGISQQLPVSELRLAGGRFSGSVGDLSLTMGGAPLAMSGATLQFAADRYRLAAPGGSWSLPAAWGGASRPTVALSNLALGTAAPFLSFNDQTRFTVPGGYSLGGSTSGRNSVELERIRAELRVAGGHWNVELTTNLRFRLGAQEGDGGSYNDALLIVSDDHVAGTLPNLRLKLAGLPLTVNMGYRDDAFSASQATLSMPSRWNSVQAQTGGIRITTADLWLAAEGADSFTIPNVALSVLLFANNTARLTADGGGRYLLNIDSTLVVNKVKTAEGLLPSKDVQLTVRAGRVSGIVSDLEFELSGFGISATNLQIIDDMVRSDAFTMKLPSKLSGVTTTFYGLELGGPKGVSVRGGALKLPDFKLGTVGVKNVSGSFMEESGSYVIAAQGMLEFTKFSVEAAFKFAYETETSSVEVRRLFVAFEGRIPAPAVPIGNSGLYFTRISGEFSLENETMTITLGTRISTPTQIKGESMAYADASVTLQLRPTLEFRANADLFVIGKRVATAQLRIWGDGFAFTGNSEFGIVRASMEVTFGRDWSDEFTFYGALQVALVVPKGYIVSIAPLGVYIPTSDITLASASLEAGKFKKGDEKIWGARGSVRVLSIFSVSALARFGSGGGVSLSPDIWQYEAVRPRGYVLSALAQGDLAAIDASQTSSGRDQFAFTASNPGYSLAIVEALAPAQRANPLPLTISSPRQAPFTATVTYTAPDSAYRIHSVEVANPEDLVGAWTVSPALGNEIVPLGLIPPPEIRSSAACLVGGPCLDPDVVTSLTPDQALDLRWDTRSFTPGLVVELYATSATGERSYIAGSETDEQALAGERRWSPAIASGSYTLELQLTGSEGAPVRKVLGQVSYTDFAAPAAPRDLKAAPQRDLSVLLSWDGAAAEGDVLGYQVRVDDGQPIQTDGRLSSLRSYGLTPGATYTLALAAYDRSGNLGPEATATVTMPRLGLTGNWPPDGAVAKNFTEISASFSGYVTGAELTVKDAAGQLVDGTSTPLLTERLGSTALGGGEAVADPETGISEVEYGATFVPADETLAPGEYTATITAWDPEAGEQVTVSWSFTVTPPTYRLFLPIS